MESLTKLVTCDQAIFDTQEIKTRDKKPHAMSDMVVIETQEAQIEDHELDVMSD